MYSIIFEGFNSIEILAFTKKEAIKSAIEFLRSCGYVVTTKTLLKCDVL